MDGHGLAKMLMVQMSQANVTRPTPLPAAEVAKLAYEHGEAFRALREEKREQYATENAIKKAEADLKKAQEKAAEARKAKKQTTDE